MHDGDESQGYRIRGDHRRCSCRPNARLGIEFVGGLVRRQVLLIEVLLIEVLLIGFWPTLDILQTQHQLQRDSARGGVRLRRG